MNLAARHGLKIIEDAAEMHGQTCNGRPNKKIGTLPIFSRNRQQQAGFF